MLESQGQWLGTCSLGSHKDEGMTGRVGDCRQVQDEILWREQVKELRGQGVGGIPSTP